MWLLTRDSFVSIVPHDTKPDHMLVRARRRADITVLWPGAIVESTPSADYAYRAAVPEGEVVEAIGGALRAIGYTTDFKGGVTEPLRHSAYLKVWSALRALTDVGGRKV